MIGRRSVIAGMLGGLAVPRALRADIPAPAFTPELAHRLATDPRRPQYHLLPRSGFVNDPNGPIQFRGETHLFYQQTPNPAGEGNYKEWGHAVSADMVHWRHLPSALAPTPGGPDKDGVWTGCAVIDGATPTLIYTGVRPEAQCLATSSDGMLTWEKRPEPIIAAPPPGLQVAGWRDPMVWRDGEHWSMVLGSGETGIGPMILLYRSNDLRHWTYVGKLYDQTLYPGGHAPQSARGMWWECPDFFPLGDKFVLIYSGPGIASHYHIGRYDGARFYSERTGILDYGTYYAPRSMVDGNGKRILWGWVSEVRTPQERMAQGWSGAISLPRELALAPDGGLSIKPAAALTTLRRNHRAATGASLAGAQLSWQLDDLSAEVAIRARNWLFVSFLGPNGERYANIAFDTVRDTLFVGNEVAPVTLSESRVIDVRVFIDGSVWEVYVNDYLCITFRQFAVRPGSVSLVIKESDLPAIESVKTWQIAPISPDRLTS